ncbi:MAG TPA: BrnT family toxin [Verrucomicrobiae bacterium]
MAEAEQVFLNAPEIMADEKHGGAEKRWLAFGRTDGRKLIACAFTVRGDLIRIISARPMSRRERKWHEEKHSLRQRSENQ